MVPRWPWGFSVGSLLAALPEARVKHLKAIAPGSQRPGCALSHAGELQWCPSVPWDAPRAGGLCPRSHLSLAENGVLRNGTEEVLSLEQCPPTKRLKTNLCNSGKEQRVEEEQTRGAQQGAGEHRASCGTGEPLWERARLFPGDVSLVSEGESFYGPYKTPANPAARHRLGSTDCLAWK